ncbi:MAG: FAD-binding oxidoreductase, partial [Microbacteriaceae bacterium]
RLLAPLRAAAPVYLDLIGELPASAVGQIHNDPDQPMPVWDRGMFLTSIDQDFVSALLPLIGPATEVPLILAEIRHLGGACLTEPEGGNAVGGRSSGYAFTLIGAPVPELFEHALPAVADQITEAITPWLHAETNINFAGKIRSAKHFAGSWSAASLDRLARARAAFDPGRVFPYAPIGE